MDKIYSRPRLLIPKIKISIFKKKKFANFNKHNSYYNYMNYNNDEYSNNYDNGNYEEYIHKQKIKRKILTIICIFIIAGITMLTMLKSVNEIINKQCKAQAKSIATKISNEQATAVMSKYNYDDLFNVEKDKNGNILMISANVINVNTINSNIAVKIQEELNNEKNNSFNIRLRKLNWNEIFSRERP